MWFHISSYNNGGECRKIVSCRDPITFDVSRVCKKVHTYIKPFHQNNLSNLSHSLILYKENTHKFYTKHTQVTKYLHNLYDKWQKLQN